MAIGVGAHDPFEARDIEYKMDSRSHIQLKFIDNLANSTYNAVDIKIHGGQLLIFVISHK